MWPCPTAPDQQDRRTSSVSCRWLGSLGRSRRRPVPCHRHAGCCRSLALLLTGPISRFIHQVQSENMNEEGEFISTRALAGLARAGSSTVRGPSMQVSFEVHHVEDRPGYLRDLLASASLRETLSPSANGLGLVVATRVGALDPALRGRLQGRSAPVALKVENPDPQCRIFKGTAWPNPSSIYGSARTFAGILAIEPEPTFPNTATALPSGACCRRSQIWLPMWLKLPYWCSSVLHSFPP